MGEEADTAVGKATVRTQRDTPPKLLIHAVQQLQQLRAQ